ncbi:hypothetical protein E2542_SST29529 [Spatholobus suberectus]|nr:hypothetical protein E2542_SST29529 [Spatholobus suberectus]
MVFFFDLASGSQQNMGKSVMREVQEDASASTTRHLRIAGRCKCTSLLTSGGGQHLFIDTTVHEIPKAG